MFDIDSDPAFAFADPALAQTFIAVTFGGASLYSELLFSCGEDAPVGDEARVFNG